MSRELSLSFLVSASLGVPPNTTLTLSEMCAVHTGIFVEMMLTHVRANARLTAPGANGANVTAEISEQSLLVKVEKQKRDAGQVRTNLWETELWDEMKVKQQAVLKAGTILNGTLGHRTPNTAGTEQASA